MEEFTSGIPSPPPYSTHLPSYDEISQLSSPPQTLTTSVTDQSEPNSQSDSTLLPPAPPAYDDIVQYPATGGQPYNSSVQQQPVVTNVQQNQTRAHSGEGEGLQQRIARRMAAIDAGIYQRQPQEILVQGGLQQRIAMRMAAIDVQVRQRQAGRTLGASIPVHSRTNAYQRQGMPHAQPTTVPSRYAYQSNQPRHNIMQHPPTVAQSPVNVQQNQHNVESGESLQQRIERRMATIEIHQQPAGRTSETSISRTAYPRIVYQQQGTPHALPTNRHAYQSNQRHYHNTIQHTPTVTQSPVNVQQDQTQAESGEGEGLQQPIARQMPAIDEGIRQRQAGIMPSEDSLPQPSNINTEEEDLQLRLEQRFAAIDNSIRRRRASQENHRKDDSCFCFP